MLTQYDREIFRELLREAIPAIAEKVAERVVEMLAAREYASSPMLPPSDYQPTLPLVFGRTTTTTHTNDVRLEE